MRSAGIHVRQDLILSYAKTAMKDFEAAMLDYAAAESPAAREKAFFKAGSMAIKLNKQFDELRDFGGDTNRRAFRKWRAGFFEGEEE